MKMPKYALPYDLDTKAMTNDGLTRSQKTQIYNQGRKVLEQNGLRRFTQYSMYATEDVENGFITVYRVIEALRDQAPDFVRYLKRCDLVRIEEDVNILELLHEQPAA